jgi:hypothetical protein
LKSTFNYCAVFDAAGKVYFAPGVIARRKTNREWLLGFEWHEKLNRSYARNLTIFAPLIQRCEYFVQDHHAGDERGTWKMPWQAWMISADYATNFKGHSRNSSPASDKATLIGC